MDHVHLGRAGVKVSRLCLGTMNFGPRTSEEDAHAILDAAREGGINFVDTANVYGRPVGVGVTETIVGRWFAKGEDRREDTVLATKVYGMMGEGPNDGRLSARHIRRACEESLRRLHTDHIDLYQMHHVDRNTPWDEVWQAMEGLVAQGKVLYVGSSNFAGWHLAKACETAKARHFLGLVSEQGLYHLLERTAELEVLPACRGYGLAFLPWSPLAGGLLAGRGPGERRRAGRIVERREEEAERLTAWESFCADLGEAPADVALAWLLHQRGVTSPIIGPRTMDQLKGALHAASLRLAKDALQRLDEIFPGPGGAAPEAYAW